MNTFTLKEVAKKLELDESVVFEMVVGKSDQILWGAVQLKYPTPAYLLNGLTHYEEVIRKARPDVTEVTITGTIEIDATTIKWDAAGFGQITTSVTQDGNEYILKGPLYIHKDDLIISANALKYFLECRGIVLVDSLEEAIPENMQETVKNYINTRLSEGQDRSHILLEVVDKFGTPKEKFFGLCARLLFSDKYSTNASDVTWRSRGRREYEKAKAGRR